MAFQRCKTSKLVCENVGGCRRVWQSREIERKRFFVLTKLIADYLKWSHVVVQIFVEQGMLHDTKS